MCAKRLTREDDVVAYVGGICFKTGPPGLVGVESEWLVTDTQHPRQHVPLPRLRAAVDAALPLPAGSAISYEPGGQLELSSQPFDGVSACHAALRADLEHLDTYLGPAGLGRCGWGVDPYRFPARQLDLPRYAAMEAFFDARDKDSTGLRDRPGRVMMCSTAAVQVCVDIGGTDKEARARWELAHAIGPVLVAAFANSPFRYGHPTGWRSTRQAVWNALDPRRTRCPRDGDPIETWTEYVLDAPVMALRREQGPWLANPGMTFGQWLRGGAYGRPDEDDLAYHLSTLFPPVRPRGCLELRMVDAQSVTYWPVPVAIVAALFEDPVAADTAREACEPIRGRWSQAARDALRDRELARSARRCVRAAMEALARLDADAELLALTAEFTERYTDRSRCPADDLLPGLQPGPGPTTHQEEMAP